MSAATLRPSPPTASADGQRSSPFLSHPPCFLPSNHLRPFIAHNVCAFHHRVLCGFLSPLCSSFSSPFVLSFLFPFCSLLLTRRRFFALLFPLPLFRSPPVSSTSSSILHYVRSAS